MTQENSPINPSMQNSEQQKESYSVSRMRELMQEGQALTTIDQAQRAVTWSIEMVVHNEMESSKVAEHFLALAKKIEKLREELARKALEKTVSAEVMAPSLNRLESLVTACESHALMAAMLQVNANTNIA